MALAYVARFATSRGKLVRYLDRKVRERGWAGTADGRAAAQAANALDAAAAALRFAEKRRLGPFALEAAEPKLREKQMGAMLRAGHGMDHVRQILACKPGEMPDFS